MVILMVLAALALLQDTSTSARQAAPQDPQALQRMVATERAFAAATAEVGIRDGFLAFFAADAVQLEAGDGAGTARLVPARAALAGRPLPHLPLAGRLVWEPFTGHVSSDGTLGWLTGGFVGLDQTLKTIVSTGAYFSVWKRQEDGTWRVWLDEGIALPDLWKDAAPFRVAPEPDAGVAGSSSETLALAEAAVALGGDAWRARLSADVRVHRDGRMPVVGRQAVGEAASNAWPRVTFRVARTEVAGSGDLGIAVGGFDTGAAQGTWVRVWKRDVTGRWRIVFETSKRR
jgi:hypothetical protein